MQVNMTAARMAAVMQNAGLAAGNPLVASAEDGGFMQLMMQLLGNTGAAQDAEGLLALAGEQKEGKLTEAQQQNAMEMLAALLAAQDPQMVQQLTAEENKAVQDAAEAPLQNVLTKTEGMPLSDAGKTGMQEEKAAEAPVPFTVEKTEPQLQPKEQLTADDLRLEGEFHSAVQKAKTPDAGKAAPEEETAAQQTVQAEEKAVTVPKETPTGKTEKPELDTAHLAKELTRTVPKALTEGKREFTMKLKPEGLGEITVRLTQEEGKTAVTILTALPETEKLIGAQLSVLQKALEPMGATVRQEPMSAMQPEQGMTDGQKEFLMWQQSQSQQHRTKQNWKESSDELEEILTGGKVTASRLDAYI